MLTSNGPVFLLIPGSAKTPVLHPGKVVEISGAEFVAAFESALTVTPGADVLIYASANGKFLQQGAKAVAIRQAEPTAVICFERVGEVVSAEQRQTYRVSTVTAGIVAKVEDEPNCPVVDVSPDGVAIVTRKQWAVGTVIHLDISHEQARFSTLARVQTAKALAGGKFRHGFLVGEKKSAARKALEQISNAVQRDQLRRLRAGAA